jgi:hypothetical protein
MPDRDEGNPGYCKSSTLCITRKKTAEIIPHLFRSLIRTSNMRQDSAWLSNYYGIVDLKALARIAEAVLYKYRRC